MSDSPLVRRTFENVPNHALTRILAAAELFGFSEFMVRWVGADEEEAFGSKREVDKYEVTVFMKEDDYGRMPPDDGPPYVKFAPNT